MSVYTQKGNCKGSNSSDKIKYTSTILHATDTGNIRRRPVALGLPWQCFRKRNTRMYIETYGCKPNRLIL